jgi:hypothetical protein
MKLHEIYESLVPLNFRKYNHQEIHNEIEELENTDKFLNDAEREKASKQLIIKNDNFTNDDIQYIDFSHVKNTDANIVRTQEEVYELFAEMEEYLEDYKNLEKSSIIPVPIVVNKNHNYWLVGGNKRALLLVSLLKSVKHIPCMVINV